MADVIKPDAFNEQFTLYLNTEGKPVQRTLREMTAGEVLRALNWNGLEADRLGSEAAPFNRMAEAYEAGDAQAIALADELTEAELEVAAVTARQAGEACARQARLLSLVQASMPEWDGSKMPLAEALRRYWPGGRHAA